MTVRARLFWAVSLGALDSIALGHGRGHLRVDLGVGSIGGGGKLDLGSASDWTWAWEASEAVLGPILRFVRPDRCCEVATSKN